MRSLSFVLLVGLLGSVPLSARAGFVFEPSTAWDGNSSGNVTVGGVTATFSAGTDVLRVESGTNRLGINDAFIDGAEQLQVTFDQDVVFEGIDFFNLESASLNLFPPFLPITGDIFFTLAVSAGSPIILGVNSGEFQVDSFQASLQSGSSGSGTSAPEPSSFALAALAVGAISVNRWRRRKRAASWPRDSARGVPHSES